MRLVTKQLTLPSFEGNLTATLVIEYGPVTTPCSPWTRRLPLGKVLPVPSKTTTSPTQELPPNYVSKHTRN